MINGEKVFISAIIVFAAFMYREADNIPNPAGAGYVMKANFWPKLILIGIIFMSLSALFKSWKKKVEDKPAPVQGEEFEEPNRVRVMLIFVLCIIYTFAMSLMGFLIATPLFVVAVLYLSEYRKVRGIIFLPLAITIAFHVGFVWLGGVIMPRGYWFFRDFSLLFY